MKRYIVARYVLAALILTTAHQSSGEEIARITNLYDAFGAPATTLTRDWGFAALVEYRGKRVLFDTGNDAGILERNIAALGIDLARLDAVVISHRHGDHTSGLEHLLRVNPDVTIYVPQEATFFKSPVPADFLTPAPGLPRDLRYFGGRDPGEIRSGSPWAKANFVIITDRTEILPGIFVISVQSEKPGTREMNELSLAVRTPRGLVVVVGCSHPGIEKILEQAGRIDRRLYSVVGGFHLVRTPEAEMRRIAFTLRDTLKVERVAPAHCTSELGFKVFLELFEERFDRAGLGAVIDLPSSETLH
jgi:7,8-dihydropterin-6-yl-methyl-4-(beta-D-ribofuranosyl)aminobenzene 5'-phosphate synthase